MALAKYTLVWGNIGDSPEKRLDFIECEEGNQQDLMDKAFETVAKECYDVATIEECSDVDPDFAWDDFRHNTPYDVFAVFDGHLEEAKRFSFY